MHSHNFSRFTQTFYNLTRDNSQVKGEVFLPAKEINAFEEAVRLFRTAKTAVCQPGDMLALPAENLYYGIAAHTMEHYSNIFRLVSLPDNVKWEFEMVAPVNPFTKLKGNPTTRNSKMIWVRKMTKRYEGDVGGFEKPVPCYVSTEHFKIGDLIDDRPVKRVWLEQNLTLAET